jgi:hypothetical protein
MFASGQVKLYPQEKLLPTSYPVGNSVFTQYRKLPTCHCVKKKPRITHIIRMLSLANYDGIVALEMYASDHAP